MSKLVVGIGAGPVGLWQALQLKKRAPDIDVVLYERRDEYVRDNQLSIHRSSLLKDAHQANDALEAATYTALNEAHETPGQRMPLWQKLRKVTRLPARGFESILRTEALARGVKINYEAVSSIEQITRAHPQCQYIVVADGTHSLIRKQLLGPDDEALVRRPILKSIDVQYQVQGQAQYMQTPTYDKARFMVAETIGKLQEDGTSRVGLRFLVDDKTFASFPQSDARHPVNWHDAFNTMGMDISGFLQLRQTYTGEKLTLPIPQAVSAYKLELSCYAARQFALLQKGEEGRDVGVFFVGNAALAVPWYKSVNIGLKTASRLAGVLAKPDEAPAQKVAAYEAMREPIVTASFNAAAKKLKGVVFYRNKVRPKLQMAKTAPIALPLLVVFAAVAVVGYIPFKIYTKLNPNARLM